MAFGDKAPHIPVPGVVKYRMGIIACDLGLKSPEIVYEEKARAIYLVFDKHFILHTLKEAEYLSSTHLYELSAYKPCTEGPCLTSAWQ